jgi:hypothetical protein
MKARKVLVAIFSAVCISFCSGVRVVASKRFAGLYSVAGVVFGVLLLLTGLTNYKRIQQLWKEQAKVKPGNRKDELLMKRTSALSVEYVDVARKRDGSKGVTTVHRACLALRTAILESVPNRTDIENRSHYKYA